MRPIYFKEQSTHCHFPVQRPCWLKSRLHLHLSWSQNEAHCRHVAILRQWKSNRAFNKHNPGQKSKSQLLLGCITKKVICNYVGGCATVPHTLTVTACYTETVCSHVSTLLTSRSVSSAEECSALTIRPTPSYYSNLLKRKHIWLLKHKGVRRSDRLVARYTQDKLVNNQSNK